MTLFISLLLFVVTSIHAAIEQDIPLEVKQQLLQGRFKEAARKLEILATENNAAAKYQLAILLLNGKGVNQSVKKAESLLKDSAKQSSDASFLLGTLYFKGKQLSKNSQLAKHYLDIASKAGNLRAEKMLLRIEAASTSSSRIKPQTQRLFQLAISSGNLSLAIKQFLNGANLNHPNEQGEPPLIAAVRLSRIEISQWLIKQEIDLRQKGRDGNTALHIASQLGQIKNVIAIEKRLNDIDITNHKNQTALMIAVKFKQQAVAQWLINQGASLLSKDRFGKSTNDYNKRAKLSLNDRVQNTITDKKNFLVSQKQTAYQIKSLQTQSKTATSPYFNWPLLTIAIAQGQLKVAKQLLVKGNSPWQATSEHNTAVSVSLENEHYKLLETMLNKHPIEQQNNQRVIEKLFFVAIKKGKFELLKKLLNRANQLGSVELINKGLVEAINEQNLHSVSLFLSLKDSQPEAELVNLSISENDFKVTKLLINKGASLDWQDEQGRTPLINAAQKQNSEVITLLLERNVSIEISDKQGLTALMWATKQNCLVCVQLLIHKGADPERPSNIGNTSIMFAAQQSEAILKILLTSQPELSTRNQQSFTALMLAISKNNKGAVTTLLSHGANPKRKNANGQDSFDLAKDKPQLLTILNDY